MSTIGPKARHYMRSQMGMRNSGTDQEQNWILGHLVTFATKMVQKDRLDELTLGPVRDMPTRPVTTKRRYLGGF